MKWGAEEEGDDNGEDLDPWAEEDKAFAHLDKNYVDDANPFDL